MYLYHQTVSPCCDSRLCHRPYVFPFASAVAGVHDDGQVTEFLQHWHGADVRGIAGVGLEGADAALA